VIAGGRSSPLAAARLIARLAFFEQWLAFATVRKLQHAEAAAGWYRPVFWDAVRRLLGGGW